MIHYTSMYESIHLSLLHLSSSVAPSVYLSTPSFTGCTNAQAWKANCWVGVTPRIGPPPKHPSRVIPLSNVVRWYLPLLTHWKMRPLFYMNMIFGVADLLSSFTNYPEQNYSGMENGHLRFDNGGEAPPTMMISFEAGPSLIVERVKE